MIIHPIAVVDQVIDEYQRYLLTEFRARDPELRNALTEALERPRFLAQEPFFQVHRPFKTGADWKALGLDGKLAKVMEDRSGSKAAFIHQSESIQHLLSPAATPLVVTTGTGSGKTECFLLPVIQNAIDDSIRFKRKGLTAILVYPMNALANDQEERIKVYLESSGHTHVRVARYDRSTKQEEREKLRKEPPHILLTNYMMLEYLLVRPADREAIFANHRCRFLVLDEVHSYRGSLGANIALLFRRLRAHLQVAIQDWAADDRTDRLRFPSPVAVATSATIKSVDETGRTPEEVRSLREEAVREFVSTLTGFPRNAFRVLGEEIQPLEPPSEAAWPSAPVVVDPPRLGDAKQTREVIAQLAGLAKSTPLAESASRAGILWTINELLVKKPLSVSGLVEAVCERVPSRRDADRGAVTREIQAALFAGAQMGDVPGALRLRAHRFIRGGWRFHRCVDPDCGKLYAMGEGNCTCGRSTAPLLLCRACGVDALHLSGADQPKDQPLLPWAGKTETASEWLLYRRSSLVDRIGEDDDDDARPRTQANVGQMKGRPVVAGSFDPATGSFDNDDTTYTTLVTLAPARNRCLACGASAGAGSILTPVALGTSAALRVLAEGVVEGLAVQHHADASHDKKERILIFSDSRQDAAHQARFITYAGRYDRMRRRLVRLLTESNGALTLSSAIRALMVRGVELRDNPQTAKAKARDADFLPKSLQERALAWEEAPLLDDLAVSAGYRSTVLNLGLVAVRYGKLETYVEQYGKPASKALGLTEAQLLYLCRCVLEEMRARRALSRPMLTYHPKSPTCPESFAAAEWERRIASPTGYPCDAQGEPCGSLDRAEVVDGVTVNNAWRRSTAGRAPRLQTLFQHLLKRMGGVSGEEKDFRDVMKLLMDAGTVDPVKLVGYLTKSTTLLQVSADGIELALLRPGERFRCNVCNVKMPWVPVGTPCRACHGTMIPWSEAEVEENRNVQRIRNKDELPLVAGEHTAQITGDERLQLEADFKAVPSVSPVNVLACSPTLEMGIDVGGLDAVLMRNVPPRPDNYAQRGGRAGRRSRVGIVVGYARSTPHDQYFFDKPQEMIAGEVAAPGISLGNRDVVARPLNAIAMGAADPGLAGRMGEYVTVKGELIAEQINALVSGFTAQTQHAADLALRAWGADVLGPAGFLTKEALVSHLNQQPERIRDAFDRVRHQILELRSRTTQLFESGLGKWTAFNAFEMIRRILGLPPEKGDVNADADDRGGGHPMRRFAEFGILPGYEFPSEPATLRLLSDAHEDEPISVVRRFGLAQYQPEAPAYARGRRWRVAGLDMTSPWNPRGDGPSWVYRICGGCGLRFDAQAHVKCPRCGSADAGGQPHPGFEFGGFLAVRDDTPVLEEEDRFSLANLLRCYPQWDGDVVARFQLPTGWLAELRDGEEIRWVNEWKPPLPSEEHCTLHYGARGFYLCPTCGRILEPGVPTTATKANKAPKRGKNADTFGHASGCARAGQPPTPLAITTKSPSTTLRLLVDLPLQYSEDEYARWGQSLGYALRTGMRHLYMLDGPEIEFELEPLWKLTDDRGTRNRGSITFLDPAIGGSGFLDRAATELHLIASRAIEHLDHKGCETACYRCLKSYQNQRFHSLLSWPHALPSLEMLATQPPRRLPRRKTDVFDPKPWLDAYDAGVGSPLELKFLRALEAKGLKVEKQIPITLEPGGKPLTVADFAIVEQRIAIYVDGAAFHVGGNLRRDRYIRARLRAATPPWRVEELTAQDLATGIKQLADLFGEFPDAPDPVVADLGPDDPDDEDIVPPTSASSGWADALELVDAEWSGLMEALRTQGIRPPDEVDMDLMQGGRATGERAVAAWLVGKLHVVLATSELSSDGPLLVIEPGSNATSVAEWLRQHLAEA